MTWINWLTIIELPAIASLILWIQTFKKHNDDIHFRMFEMLSLHRIEVAKHYASLSILKDVEKRLIDQLLRFESKYSK